MLTALRPGSLCPQLSCRVWDHLYDACLVIVKCFNTLSFNFCKFLPQWTSIFQRI